VLRVLNFLLHRFSGAPQLSFISAAGSTCSSLSFPVTRRAHRLLGAPVAEVHPVLGLADGVGLAIGGMA
jgi:hypothetical protein